MLDLTYSLRLLRKSPGFTLTAVLCLGLGIGVNSSIFSLVNYLLLRPLPVIDPGRLVVLSRGPSPLLSYPDYRDLRDRNQSLVGLAASNPTESSLDFDGSSHSAAAEAVSLNYPAVIGVRPFLGRWFASEDEPAAVISYKAWQRLFRSDPNVLGKRVRSESQWYTIVGVAPREFTGIYLPMSMDLWVPFRLWTRQNSNLLAQLEDRSAPRVMLFGRLKPGIAPAQAAAELNAIAAQVRKEEPRSPRTTSPISVDPVRGIPNPSGRRMGAPIVILLMSVVGLVLLIACVNVGNLLLARGTARRREIAVKISLGAPRSRILRQLLTESLVLAFFGGIAGIFLGAWTSRLLEAMLRSSPYGESVELILSADARVFAFTVALSFFTTLVFGLAPAWRASRTDAIAALKGETPAGGRFRLRRFSLLAQVSVSLFLVLTAGLFLRVLLRFHSADPGFAVENRLSVTAYVSAPEFTPETARQFYAQTLDRVRALPGVRSAALTDWLPLQPINPGCVALPGGEPVPATSNVIDAGYLSTMHIPLVAGRNFSAADRRNGPRVAIINQTLAARLWPHEPAIGKRFVLGCRAPAALEVVGIARDSMFRSLGEPPLPHVYAAFSQEYSGGLTTLIIETASDPGLLAEPVRKMLIASSAGVRVYGSRPLTEHVAESYWMVRWEAAALAIFASLALVLAAVGLYGVVAYHVTLRSREIGIRMAIGARPGDVFRLVLRQGLGLTLAGVAVGLGLSVLAARVLARFLYGLSATDLATYTAAAMLWIAVSLLACYLPARRAARVEPLTALHYE